MTTHPLQYMKVTGTIGDIIADGLDADDLPDEVAVKATIRFTFMLNPGDSVLLPYHPQGPRTMLVDPIAATLDVQGRVTMRGKPYVKLWCPDQWTNPATGFYRVDFIDVTSDGRPLQLRSIQIPAIPDSEVDLTDVWAVPGTPPPGVTRGERGVGVDGWTVTGNDVVLNLDDGTSLPAKTFPALVDAATNAAAAQQAKSDTNTLKGEVQEIHDNVYDVAIPQMQGLLTDTVAAKTGAVTAKGQSEAARDLARQYRDDAAGYVGGVADNAISTPKIQDGAVTKAKTATAVQTSLDKADSAYQKPGTGIPKTDLAAAVQTSLGKADSGYQKPGAGIPKTDLAATVGTSLDKADSAYQKPGAGIPKTDLATAVQTSLGKADAAVARSVEPLVLVIGHTGDTARKVGTGSNLTGFYIPWPTIITQMIVDFGTPDGSLSSVVRIDKGGPSLGSVTINAAAVRGTAAGPFSFAAGDYLFIRIDSIGGTPGKGCTVTLVGTMNLDG
ncbi:hypothetical protein [Rhodococcus sp. NPDC127528]|uniref:hypothetical protein n=1 Tax=unclassified Rhodococcus (in: high G+C Gram-positive bacteria) TaxID=192944 RepID=UPI00362706FD